MFLATLLALTAAPVAPVAPVATPAPPAARPPARVVCRTSTVTGSRLARRRTCRTVEEWAQIDGNTNENLRDTQRNMPPTLPPGTAPGH